MQKIFTILLLLLLSTSISWSQNKFLEQIKKERYTSVDKKTSKLLLENPADINANFGRANLLIQKKHEGFEPDSAYRYILITQELYTAIKDKKELAALRKIKISKSKIKSTISKVYKAAMDATVAVNTKEAYTHFLDYYPNAPESYTLRAKVKRDMVDYTIISESNCTPCYEKFIATHEASEITELAQKKIHHIEYALAKRSANKLEFKDYIEKYPNSKYYKDAMKAYKNLQYLALTDADSWYAYKRLIEEHPQDKGVDAALDSILAIGIRNRNLDILEYCIAYYTGERREKAFMAYYDIYTEDGETSTLDLFFGSEKPALFDKLKASSYRWAALGDTLSLEKPYNVNLYDLYTRYIKSEASTERRYVTLQRIISNNIKRRNWTAALDSIKKYEVHFEKENKKIKQLKDILKKNWDNTVQIYDLGKGINTSMGEYVPVISADDKLLYFCGINRLDGVGLEDIYRAEKTANGWGKTQLIKELSFPNSNDAPMSISADGNKMILFKSGKLSYTVKTAQGWNLPKAFPPIINQGRWQADAMITSDGKALLFSSTYKNGLNINHSIPYHGAKNYPSDIYISVLDEDNNWGTPINLGTTINTKYGDRMPFLHPDMKTLYFSSDGHGGLGLLDVYKSTRLSDTCWNCWSEPINLGKEINSIDNDWGYKISTDGEKAYFAKGPSGENSNDIFYVSLPNSMRPNFVATISGKLSNKHKKGISATIYWEDLVTGEVIGTSQSDPSDGSFFIVLPLGKMYGYYVEEDTYYPASDNIDLRDYNKAISIQKDIDMIAMDDMIKQGTAVAITNLFFNSSESELLSYSKPELRRVARIINKNKLKVEISGHTDNIGDNQKNQLLSEQRAKAVKEFLIAAGCDTNMLIAKGYGKTKAIADNKTESGRAKNRRVELRYIQ